MAEPPWLQVLGVPRTSRGFPWWTRVSHEDPRVHVLSGGLWGKSSWWSLSSLQAWGLYSSHLSCQLFTQQTLLGTLAVPVPVVPTGNQANRTPVPT